MTIKTTMEFLGKRAVDKVTGAMGVVTSASFDLYGCEQVILSPPVGKDGKHTEGRWYDVARLNVVDHELVMAQPDFGSTSPVGPADKPLPRGA